MAPRPIRRVLAHTLLALSLVSSTLFMGAGPASAVPATYGSCAAVQVIAVRGTSEAQPSGGVLPPLATQITNRTGKSVLTYGLPYPATSDWTNSVNTGISQLADRLTISSLYCPAQRYVLVGYSQGAWVIGDALAGGGGGVAPRIPAALGSKVSAIVLYGDPRFRAGESFNAGDFRAGVSGVIPRDAGGLSAYASRIRSYCYADDTICQNGATGSGHFRYSPNSIVNSAVFVISRIGA